VSRDHVDPTHHPRLTPSIPTFLPPLDSLPVVTLARDPPQSWPADPERRPASSPASRTGRTPAPPAASRTTGGQTRLRMTCLSRRRGPPPHASTVMSPRARAWLHGSPHAARSSSNFVPVPERPVTNQLQHHRLPLPPPARVAILCAGFPSPPISPLSLQGTAVLHRGRDHRGCDLGSKRRWFCSGILWFW
jgi:hypothetical protein